MYKQYIDCKYFEVAESAVDVKGGVKLCRVTRVLPKGQLYIAGRLRAEARGKQLAIPV